MSTLDVSRLFATQSLSRGIQYECLEVSQTHSSDLSLFTMLQGCIVTTNLLFEILALNNIKYPQLQNFNMFLSTYVYVCIHIHMLSLIHTVNTVAKEMLL